MNELSPLHLLLQTAVAFASTIAFASCNYLYNLDCYTACQH